MILIRGLGSQLVHWPPDLYEGFAKRDYRCIIFDNRDVGLSQRCPADGVSAAAHDIIGQIDDGQIPKAAYAIADMAWDVIGLMDALDIDKAHVFGISMGGMVAQLLAAYHANKLLSATIVMSSLWNLGPPVLKGLLSYPESRDQHLENWVQVHHTWGSPGYPMTDAEVRQQAACAWDRGVDADGRNRQTLAIMTCADRSEIIQGINLPCLVIHGADDTLIPPEAGREIARLIPDAELVVIDGMGHVITPSLSPIIIDTVGEFLNRPPVTA